ncbi:hypothetical protein EMPS_06615 [Entomortierella parvispora]|uniref:Galactose oxidase n=1 Tax=Entomortierella parvispora TaxID=205924 RepID=A0A9P3LXM5_9FUNG|nr:hypothetical protein EMPS_06615 [Entomortierella parvispora]
MAIIHAPVAAASSMTGTGGILTTTAASSTRAALASPSVHNDKKSHFRLLSAPLVPFLLLATLATTACCASTSFQPVSYSTTALMGSRLFIYGGLVNASDPLSYSSQFVSLSLVKGFLVDNDNSGNSDLPWQFLPRTFATAMAPGATTQDQSRLVVGGTRGIHSTGSSPTSTVALFDTTKNTWSQGPDLPKENTTIPTKTAVSDDSSTDPSDLSPSSSSSPTSSPSPSPSTSPSTSPSPTPSPAFQLLSPGMSLDSTVGTVLQFGGLNGSMNVTNTLSILKTNKSSPGGSWSYSGPLESVPGLYAPIVVYLPRLKATLIMGGCNQANEQGRPVQCAPFDTLYTLGSDAVAAAASSEISSATSLKATKITVRNNSTDTNSTLGSASPAFTIPSPRWMPCAVVLQDGNVFMMGGEDPVQGDEIGGQRKNALSDAWVLDTRNWTWLHRSIGGLPTGGIRGHSCQMASYEQILVIGGVNATGHVYRPLSVIKMRDWSWSGRFYVPSLSPWIKVALSLTVIVVVGAIVAGLVIRHRRNKRAAAIAAANLESGSIRGSRKKKQEKDSGVELGSISSSSHRRTQRNGTGSGSASGSSGRREGGGSGSRNPRSRREHRRSGGAGTGGSRQASGRSLRRQSIQDAEAPQRQVLPQDEDTIHELDSVRVDQDDSWRTGHDLAHVEVSSPTSTLVPEGEENEYPFQPLSHPLDHSRRAES